MTFMHMGAIIASASQLIVRVGSGSAQDTDAFLAYAGFEFGASGGKLKNEGGFSTQQISWIDPISAASSDYEIRGNFFGSALSPRLGTVTTGVNEWHDFSSDRIYVYECLRFCVEIGTLTLDIRYQDGSDPRNNVLSLHDGASCMSTGVHSISIEAT